MILLNVHPDISSGRESILLYPGAVEGVSGGVSEGVSGEYRTPDGSRCHVLSLNVLDAVGQLMQEREFVRPLGEFVDITNWY